MTNFDRSSQFTLSIKFLIYSSRCVCVNSTVQKVRFKDVEKMNATRVHVRMHVITNNSIQRNDVGETDARVVSFKSIFFHFIFLTKQYYVFELFFYLYRKVYFEKNIPKLRPAVFNNS